MPRLSGVVAAQRELFLFGATRTVAWRKAQVQVPRALFVENHDELCDAMWNDLQRNVVDADSMDVVYNVKEVDDALKRLIPV